MAKPAAKPLSVLIVEDDDALRKFYQHLFKDPRLAPLFSPTLCASAEDGIKSIPKDPPALVILDWVLPGKNGMVVLDAIRSDPKARAAQVFVVTSLAEQDREVEALESGADDFLRKPFEREVLIARLLNLAKRLRLPPDVSETVAFKDLKLEMPSGRLWRGDKPLPIQHKEAQLLSVFLKRPNMVHSPEFLWDAVWGYASEDYKNTLTVTVSNLRRKLGRPWGDRLQAIKGQGYVLNGD